MKNTEYIKELQSPSLLVSTDKILSPAIITAYLDDLEVKRLTFIEYVTGLEEQVIRVYLKELRQAKQIILNRGYIGLDTRNISSLIIGGFESEGMMMMENQRIDAGLLKSVDKSIDYLSNLYEMNINLIEIHNKPVASVLNKETNDDNVISSTQGLAEFIGCGKTLAYSIIKSKELVKMGIQYKVGNCWKFNKVKLQELMDKHPEFLGKFHCIR